MQLKDKIIVFSDNIFALREYAVRMRKPMIYGGTSHQERTRILHKFKHSADVSFLSLSSLPQSSLASLDLEYVCPLLISCAMSFGHLS